VKSVTDNHETHLYMRNVERTATGNETQNKIIKRGESKYKTLLFAFSLFDYFILCFSPCECPFIITHTLICLTVIGDTVNHVAWFIDITDYLSLRIKLHFRSFL
jgi:hypothetical protein